MTSKPVKLVLIGLQTPRERIWAAVRELATEDRSGTFTTLQVEDATEPLVKFSVVREYLWHLSKAGYIGEVKPAKPMREHGNRMSAPVYKLVKGQGEPPRVGPEGAPVLQGQGNEAMWRAMKVLKSFDYRDIVAAASIPGVFQVADTTARKYVNYLAHAGYFQTLRAPTRLLPGRYRLERKTGPHAPAITRAKVVIDRNTGTVAMLETAQEVCDGLE